MAWQGIEGHDRIVEQFRRALARDRLASTFLFVGPAGIGKRRFAERFAATLLCQAVPAVEMAPCGRCDSCVQVAAGTHPDLHVVEKPPDKSSIPLKLLIGEEPRRMREGLCHDIALKPFLGGRRVAIIDDADDLNEEGANALLKTLEEPPPRSVLILIGTSAMAQLPTIRSRSQIVRFLPLESGVVTDVLVEQGLVADAARAERLAAMSGGSVAKAVTLADDELWAFRARLLGALAERPIASVALAGQVVPIVEAAGKEAPARRRRARQLIEFVIEFGRQVLRARSGMAPEGDELLLQAVARRTAVGGGGDEAAALVDRSLEALLELERNAHLATLLESWLDDLATASVAG